MTQLRPFVRGPRHETGDVMLATDKSVVQGADRSGGATKNTFVRSFVRSFAVRLQEESRRLAKKKQKNVLASIERAREREMTPSAGTRGRRGPTFEPESKAWMHTGCWCSTLCSGVELTKLTNVLTKSISFRSPLSTSFTTTCPSHCSSTSTRVQTSSPFSSSTQYSPPTASSSISTSVSISPEGGVDVPLPEWRTASRFGDMPPALSTRGSPRSPAPDLEFNLRVPLIARAGPSHLPRASWGCDLAQTHRTGTRLLSPARSSGDIPVSVKTLRPPQQVKIDRVSLPARGPSKKKKMVGWLKEFLLSL